MNDLCGHHGYLPLYLFLGLADTAQRRMQIKKRFWNMYSQEQRDPAAAPLLPAIPWIHQTPRDLHRPGRNTGRNKPFSHLSKSPRHILINHSPTPPQDLPSSRDTRPKIIIQIDSIGQLSPHVHLATKHQMLPVLRYVAQRVIRIHLAPVLKRSTIIEVGTFDLTVRVSRVRVAPASVPAVEIPVRVCAEEGSVAPSDHFGESGSVAVHAGTPDLDDGVGGQGQVEVEDVFFPYDWGQRVRVNDGNRVVDEGLQVRFQFRGRHVICACVDFVAAEVEE